MPCRSTTQEIGRVGRAALAGFMKHAEIAARRRVTQLAPARKCAARQGRVGGAPAAVSQKNAVLETAIGLTGPAGIPQLAGKRDCE